MAFRNSLNWGPMQQSMDLPPAMQKRYATEIEKMGSRYGEAIVAGTAATEACKAMAQIASEIAQMSVLCGPTYAKSPPGTQAVRAERHEERTGQDQPRRVGQRTHG